MLVASCACYFLLWSYAIPGDLLLPVTPSFYKGSNLHPGCILGEPNSAIHFNTSESIHASQETFQEENWRFKLFLVDLFSSFSCTLETRSGGQRLVLTEREDGLQARFGEQNFKELSKELLLENGQEWRKNWAWVEELGKKNIEISAADYLDALEAELVFEQFDKSRVRNVCGSQAIYDDWRWRISAWNIGPASPLADIARVYQTIGIKTDENGSHYEVSADVTSRTVAAFESNYKRIENLRMKIAEVQPFKPRRSRATKTIEAILQVNESKYTKVQILQKKILKEHHMMCAPPSPSECGGRFMAPDNGPKEYKHCTRYRFLRRIFTDNAGLANDASKELGTGASLDDILEAVVQPIVDANLMSRISFSSGHGARIIDGTRRKHFFFQRISSVQSIKKKQIEFLTRLDISAGEYEQGLCMATVPPPNPSPPQKEKTGKKVGAKRRGTSLRGRGRGRKKQKRK